VLRAELRGPTAGVELEVGLEVESGACLALAGPSGAGKTTVLRALAGLARPRSGWILCGKDRWLDTEEGIDVPADRRRVGFVFQDHALFPHLSAWRNVAYALDDRPRAERPSQARALLDRLGIADRAEARPRELSGGERQRVALARALARRPRVMLLDEPLSSLDARTRATAAGLLAAALRDSGAPTVLVTHDFEEAAQLADRVAVVDGGRIVQQGTPGELVAQPASAFVADFTGAIVLTGLADGTRVALDGGGVATAAQEAHGPVALSLHPWDVVVEAAEAPAHGSARNRLPARVTSVTRLGNRVRVGLDAGQPLAAEITPEAADALALEPGVEVVAVWKAAATRLVAR
jgi:molybdate transport system ATP-binding protein